MKYVWAVVVVACLVVSAAMASGSLEVNTARSLSMGTASIGVADDAAAWLQNPAGLASLNVPVAEGKLWGNDVMGTFSRLDYSGSTSSSAVSSGTDDSVDGWRADWSGWQPAKGMGAGAGYRDEDYQTRFGAGFGMAIKDMPLSIGANVVRVDPDSGDGNTLLNLGLMYKFEQPGKAPLRVGVKIEDVTDEVGLDPLLNLGIYWPATPQFGFAVDVLDILGKQDEGPFVNAGAEMRFGLKSEWAVRAGLLDTGDGRDITGGVGYTAGLVRIDAGYADTQDGQWIVSAATSF